MTSEFLESLLWMSESDSLDFKQEQYLFDGGTDEQKGELLKDILAFANSWRGSDAYILTGVKENRGGRAEILGVNKHIISNNLQQFVDGKTNKPLDFKYEPFEFEGKQIGIITIPIQKKPFFLKQKYGRVEAEVVYIRRGDATVKAKPDEISQMGHSKSQNDFPQAPQLRGILIFDFSYRPGNETCQLTISVKISNLSPLIPSLNTKVKLWHGNNPVDLIKTGQTIHYGEPYEKYETKHIPTPEMNKPNMSTFRLSFGSDQAPLKVSDYLVKIYSKHELNQSGYSRNMSRECYCEWEIVRENIFLHEVKNEV